MKNRKSAYELWKELQQGKLTKDQFKNELKNNGVIVQKCKTEGCINPVDFESNSKYCMACFTSHA